MKNNVGRTSSTILNSCSFQTYRLLHIEEIPFFKTHPLSKLVTLFKVLVEEYFLAVENPSIIVYDLTYLLCLSWHPITLKSHNIYLIYIWRLP